MDIRRKYVTLVSRLSRSLKFTGTYSCSRDCSVLSAHTLHVCFCQLRFL